MPRTLIATKAEAIPLASGMIGKCQHIFGLYYEMPLNLCKVLNVVYLLRYSIAASNIEQLSCEPTRLL